MKNDELRAALESKLRHGAGYTSQDLTAFALGVEWARSDAAPDEVIELTAALEIRAILEQIKEVAATVHAAGTGGRARGIRDAAAGIGSIPVVAPLPDIAIHVVQAPGVGLLLADSART